MEKVIELIKHVDSVASTLTSLLGDLEKSLSLAVTIAAEYSDLYMLIATSFDKLLLRYLEDLREKGRFSTPKEGERFIPLMVISTQPEDLSPLSKTLKKLFDEARKSGNPFYYLVLPDAEGRIETGEKVVKIISTNPLGRSDSEAIIVVLRSFKDLPTEKNLLIINDSFSLDKHGIIPSLKDSIKNVSISLDNETFGGGPVVYCLHMLAKKGKKSLLDVSLSESLLDNGAVKNIFQILTEAARRIAGW